MTFEIIKKEVNAIYRDCFDLTIRNNKTGGVVVFDCAKIWDDDQQSLEDMFNYDNDFYDHDVIFSYKSIDVFTQINKK